MDLQFPAGGRATMNASGGGGGSLHAIAALVARSPAPAPRRLLAGHVVLLSRRVHCRTLCSDRVSFDRPSVSVEQFSRACLL
jgi:hypothetical protein